jgi:hypothetical protein
MRKYYILAVLASLFITIFATQNTNAISSNVVISQIQLGNAASAKNEFVEIYNNNSVDIEITNWCLSYLSSSLSPREMACFVPENDSTHILLPGHSFALAVSNEISMSEPSINGDIKFSSTLSGTAGYVRLFDQNKTEIDKVGWGASTPDNNLAGVPSVGKILSRKIIGTFTPQELQDTDVNSDDFEQVVPRLTYTYGLIYEQIDVCKNIIDIQQVVPDGYDIDLNGNCNPLPVDVCTNLDEIQIVVPDGYLLDENGNCVVDVCLNIDGLQLAVPESMDLDDKGNCVAHDECSNLLEIQAVIPDGYMRSDDNDCLLNLLPLKITELLPNANGSDIGKEFIEIYNPNDSDVDLTNYVFYVGVDDVKFYSFSAGSHIEAGEYQAFYNDFTKFTLLNSTSSVRLKSIDGTLIDETPIYVNPKENMAWALIDGTWQYTNQPTPNSLNLHSLIEPEPVPDVDVAETVIVSDLKPCAANQYRSPETNRCRLLPTSDSVLEPCKDGQYRSEETNRCRSIVSDVETLIPCAEGQERNPDTNRCRSIATAVLGASDLKPCDPGQERNPDTNRCRNIVSAIPQADYAPEQTSETSNNYVLWWSLAGVGLVAIIYGVWEWRQEIGRLVRKIRLSLHHNK